MTLAQWRAVVDLTLTSAFLTVQAAARVMADGGSIIAIASLSAVQPGRAVSAYCAAKAGVVALVDVAALELGPRGIRVNAVAPGLVRTPATEPIWAISGMVEVTSRIPPLALRRARRHCRRSRVPHVRRCVLHHRAHPAR